MNAPAAPLISRLRAEIADLRQQLEECKLEAREEGARLAIWAGSRAIRDLHDGLNSGVTGIRNAALTEAMDAVNFLSIPEVLKGKP